MSLLKIRYRSKLMCRHVHFNVFLPDDTPDWFLQNNKNYDRPTKTLFLLHGYDGDQDTWIVESDVLNYAYQQNLAVVFPAAENSFYVDSAATGKQYCSFIGKELVEYVRKNFNLAQKREDTLIVGFSMGGFRQERSRQRLGLQRGPHQAHEDHHFQLPDQGWQDHYLCQRGQVYR